MCSLFCCLFMDGHSRTKPWCSCHWYYLWNVFRECITTRHYFTVVYPIISYNKPFDKWKAYTKKHSLPISLALWGKWLCLVLRSWNRVKAVSSDWKIKDVKKDNDVFKSELTGGKKVWREQSLKSMVVLLVVGRWQVAQSNTCLSDPRKDKIELLIKKAVSNVLYISKETERLMQTYTEHFTWIPPFSCFHLRHVGTLTLCHLCLGVLIW